MEDQTGWRGGTRELLHHDAHPRHPSSTSHGLARLAAQQGRQSVAPGSTTRHSSAPLRIVVMEGDGIGPEITAATMAVLRAADDIFKLGLSFTPVAIGLAALRAQRSEERRVGKECRARCSRWRDSR